MPKDQWAKYGKNWQYYRPEARRKAYFEAKPSKQSKRTRLPFGEFRGRNFDQCPRSYLEWLLTAAVCREEWKGEITAVLDKWNKQRA